VSPSISLKATFTLYERLSWDSDAFNAGKEALRLKDVLIEKKINDMIYFQPSYFLKCMPQRGPPSFVLYFRVRAVFDVFGGKLDSKSSKPLFNTLAFMKAREVVNYRILRRIL